MRTQRTPVATARRLDIQALRALAVAAVVVEHVWGWPAGGFVGVDVFFAVSGYLITALLIREHERTGRISMRAFTGRRFRRLAPAAVTTTVVTLAVSFALFPPPRFLGVLTDAGWSAAVLANWHFAQQGTDYFAQDGPVSPFQHFWSLAVEEQFYVVWPVALIGVLAIATRGRRGRGPSQEARGPLALSVSARLVVALVMAAIAGGSFVFALERSASSPTLAYFSTLDRAWELGVGVLLAVGAPVWRRLPPSLGSAASWVGFATIAAGVLVITPTDPFPAPWALVPVLGTALVLIGGSPDAAVTPFPLRSRPVQYLGDVSYSLYLWHFPITIVTAFVEPGARWAAAALSLAVAVLSFHGIERPFLRAPGRSKRQWRAWTADHARTFRRSGIAALAVAAVASAGVASVRVESRTDPQALLETVAAADAPDAPGSGASANGDGPARGPAVTALRGQVRDALGATSWPTLSPTVDRYLGDDKPGSPTNNCANLERLLPQQDCTFGPASAKTTVMLIGDSVAAYERPAFESLVEASGGSLRLISRAAWTCPFADVEVSSRCSAYRDATVSLVHDVRPDIVVLTNTYDALVERGTKLPATETSRRVTASLDRIADDVGRFVFVTPPPRGKALGACYRPGASPADCVTRTSEVWRASHGVYTGIAADRDAAVVDVRDVLCLRDACPAFIGDHLVRQDPTHLAYDFATTLGPAVDELFAEQGVSLTGR